MSDAPNQPPSHSLGPDRDWGIRGDFGVVLVVTGEKTARKLAVAYRAELVSRAVGEWEVTP